jgi:hypothetical protein
VHFLQQASGSLRECISPRTIDNESKQVESEFLARAGLLAAGVAPVVQQMMVQVNFNGASFGAGAAK